MSTTAMSDAARHILHVVCLREGLRLDGWDHYFTGMSDDGCATFAFDRAPEDGPGGFVVRVTPDGYVIDPDSRFNLEAHSIDCARPSRGGE